MVVTSRATRTLPALEAGEDKRVRGGGGDNLCDELEIDGPLAPSQSGNSFRVQVGVRLEAEFHDFTERISTVIGWERA